MSNGKNMLRFLFFLVSVALVTSGCSFWKSQDTKPPAPQVGIIDMNKAIKAHPRYNEAAMLEKQYNALAAKVQAGTSLPQPVEQAAPDMTNVADGINAALEQEFNAKMADKKAELNAGLKAKAEEFHSKLSADLAAYREEIDKIYQPQIFSLQLKLKTVQLTNEEMASLQTELERLQNERKTKLASKEQELDKKLDAMMAPEQAAVEQQLSAYARQLHNELSQKGAAQTAEIASRNQPPVSSQSSQADLSSLEQQLTAKQREIQSLQQFIIEDIRSKAAKTAAERGLEAVLAKAKVNISAVDITDAVISSFSSSNNIRLQ